MGLFSKKKSARIVVSASKSSVEKRTDHNKKSNSIPSLEFMKSRDALVKPLENSMVANAVRLQSLKSPTDRLPVLQAIVNDFYSLKTLCKQAGPEYAKYFSKSWEHCHNSKNGDFSYIKRFETELNQIIGGAKK